VRGARRKYAGAARIAAIAALLVAMAAGVAHAQAKAAGAPQAQAKAAGAAQAKAKAAGTLILGVIESVTVDDMNDPSSAGRMVVKGKEITIPRDLLIGLPAGRMTLRNLVLEAPAACKSQQPPQSGLAVSDTCLDGGTPALARIVANATESGGMVASLVMVQKDSVRTLARMKADSPRVARAKARASRRQYQ
jgi:hypothetical protein